MRVKFKKESMDAVQWRGSQDNEAVARFIAAKRGGDPRAIPWRGGTYLDLYHNGLFLSLKKSEWLVYLPSGELRAVANEHIRTSFWYRLCLLWSKIRRKSVSGRVFISEAYLKAHGETPPRKTTFPEHRSLCDEVLSGR